MDELREQVRALLEARSKAHEAGLAVAEKAKSENRSLTAEETAEVEKYVAEKRAADEKRSVIEKEIEKLEADERADRLAAEARAKYGTRPTSSTTVNEPATYRRNGPHSWFLDFARMGKDFEARERIVRGQRERMAEMEKRSVDMTTAAGAGGEFAPPLWEIDQFVAFLRPHRVIADLIGSRTLPKGVSSINLPKVATGTAVAVQTTQGTQVQDTAMTTTSVGSGIITLAGQQTVSLQLLEQSGIAFDEVVLRDLAEDYAAKVDVQILTAAASAPWQGGGLANVAGAGSVTYTDASPAVAGTGKLYAKIAQAIETVATTRYLPPTAIVMHPRRWGWITASFDGNNRPLVVPSAFAMNPVGTQDQIPQETVRAVGQMQGLPVFTDANIPTNLGAGTNQDVIYVLRESDLYFYESPLQSASFDATYAGALEVLYRVHAYSAFIAQRYPASICAISGTGLVTPSF
jgi:HK97 family phage major capsid protein